MIPQNRFAQGILARQARAVSDRHHRAGVLGGLATARQHAGNHARWGAMASHPGSTTKKATRPAETNNAPANGKQSSVSRAAKGCEHATERKQQRKWLSG